MPSEQILSRLRRFLLVFSACIFFGTLLELIFINHTQEPMQWIPFGLCGLGMLASLGAYARPQRKMLVAMRASMAVVTLGSLVGVAEHIQKNLAFALEIHPNLTLLQQAAAAVGGASPLMAPGVLAMAAVLCLLASYYHPALESEAASARFVRTRIEERG